MKNFGKVLGINLLVILGYSLLFALSREFMGYMMFTVATHVVVLFVLAIANFFMKKSSLGGVLLLCSLIVLIIGFSACMGGMALLDINFLH